MAKANQFSREANEMDDDLYGMKCLFISLELVKQNDND